MRLRLKLIGLFMSSATACQKLTGSLQAPGQAWNQDWWWWTYCCSLSDGDDSEYKDLSSLIRKVTLLNIQRTCLTLMCRGLSLLLTWQKRNDISVASRLPREDWPNLPARQVASFYSTNFRVPFGSDASCFISTIRLNKFINLVFIKKIWDDMNFTYHRPRNLQSVLVGEVAETIFYVAMKVPRLAQKCM